MQYKIKPKNRIECKSRNGDYNGYYIIKNLEIVLGAKNQSDLRILMMFRHKIEKEIMDYLNSKSYRDN